MTVFFRCSRCGRTVCIDADELTGPDDAPSGDDVVPVIGPNGVDLLPVVPRSGFDMLPVIAPPDGWIGDPDDPDRIVCGDCATPDEIGAFMDDLALIEKLEQFGRFDRFDPAGGSE